MKSRSLKFRSGKPAPGCVPHLDLLDLPGVLECDRNSKSMDSTYRSIDMSHILRSASCHPRNKKERSIRQIPDGYEIARVVLYIRPVAQPTRPCNRPAVVSDSADKRRPAESWIEDVPHPVIIKEESAKRLLIQTQHAAVKDPMSRYLKNRRAALRDSVVPLAPVFFPVNGIEDEQELPDVSEPLAPPFPAVALTPSPQSSPRANRKRKGSPIDTASPSEQVDPLASNSHAEQTRELERAVAQAVESLPKRRKVFDSNTETLKVHQTDGHELTETSALRSSTDECEPFLEFVRIAHSSTPSSQESVPSSPNDSVSLNPMRPLRGTVETIFVQIAPEFHNSFFGPSSPKRRPSDAVFSRRAIELEKHPFVNAVLNGKQSALLKPAAVQTLVSPQ